LPGSFFLAMRRKTKEIRIGTVRIGGDAPIVVQSMVKKDHSDPIGILAQIRELKKVGCEIVRLALPSEEATKLLPLLRREGGLPIVGDVHFNYRIAIRAMEVGIDGIRINPGTINNVKKMREIALLARETKTPVRIGINVGSLEKRFLREKGRPVPERMVESALYNVRIFEDVGWTEIKVSLKASNVWDTVEAYRRFSKVSDYPLHVGITEAGPMFSGLIKSSIGIGILLSEGIGDTIRVSLTADPTYEVMAAYKILRGLELRKRGVNLVSCPTCGRCTVDLFKVAEEFEKDLLEVEAPLDVAIMGCEVNGPQEAKNADIGIAFSGRKAVIFLKGKVFKRGIPSEAAREVLKEEIYNLLARPRP